LTIVVDAQYAEPRLAALYDPLDPDRPDLEVYAAMAAELGPRVCLRRVPGGSGRRI
jgi:hypothetical protein